MTDELEREVRAMLQQRAGDMPGGYDAPPGLAGRVARRRTTRMALAGAGVVVVVALAAGAIGAAATKSKHGRVITSVPTTVPQTTPTTRATGTTTQTTPLVTTPTVAGVGCPTRSVTAPFDVAAPQVGPRKIPGLDPPIANRVRSYVGPRAGFATDARALEPDIVLAPKGWSCRVYRSNGGGAVLYVFPPSAQGSFGTSDSSWTTSEQYAGTEVRVVTAVLGHNPDASLACSVFAGEPLVDQWVATSGVSASCAVTNGRTLTKLAPGVYSFVDTDGTRGVGAMRVRATTPLLDGDYGIVTCKLTGGDASLCDAIISDYTTRYPGSVPATQPPAGPGGGVDTRGRVGTLQFGTSTEADVRSTVGAPDATTRASFSAPGFPGYQVLGYDCTTADTPTRIPLVVQPALRGPYCATIYLVNVATKTLAGFETTSPKYATAQGTVVGMTPAEAQQREGRQLIPHGCWGSFIQLGSFYQNGPGAAGAAEFIFVGPGANDRVKRIATESNVNPVGVLFC
jgi:hypothetical protein